jgi:hypothetical protein
MILRKTIFTCAFIGSMSLVSPIHSYAETTDFGGYPDRFRAGGDQTPPRCQIDAPRSATSSFFVQWDCSDDVSPDDEIRTELWLLRRGAPTTVKIADFLGFPASVQINESILQSESFTDGLPITLRLVARDRAGNGSLSPFLTILGQDNSVDTCDLLLVSDTTESDGGTTGLPSMTVLLDNAMVSSQQTSNVDLRLTTPISATPDPCEIDSICSDGSLSFVATVLIDDDNNATASISITPGSVLANVSGSAVVDGTDLQSLSLQGTTVIDNVVTNVTLSCQQ